MYFVVPLSASMIGYMTRDWRSISSIMCCTHPYKKQETPNCDDGIRAQRLAYATIGPVAQLTKAGTWEEKKQTIGYLDTPRLEKKM